MREMRGGEKRGVQEESAAFITLEHSRFVVSHELIRSAILMLRATSSAPTRAWMERFSLSSASRCWVDSAVSVASTTDCVSARRACRVAMRSASACLASVCVLNRAGSFFIAAFNS